MGINKKFVMPVLVFVVVIVSVVVTMVMMNGERVVDQNSTDASVNNNEINLEENEMGHEMKRVFVTIEGEKLEVELARNATVSALLKMLPLELSMSDLNGNEKYAYLAETLPVDVVRPGRVEAGDVMLFGDDCLVIFYESFETEYSYTRIGHIDGLPELGGGEVVVGFDLEN